MTQRSGSGTRRSTAESSSVSTSTASKPTCSRSGVRATTRASAARIGSLKSTLTVPGETRLGVESVRQHVEARVHPAAGAEALEPQRARLARDDRVGEAVRGAARRDVEPRARDPGHAQQRGRSHVGPLEEAAEVRLGGAATGRRGCERDAVRTRPSTGVRIDTRARSPSARLRYARGADDRWQTFAELIEQGNVVGVVEALEAVDEPERTRLSTRARKERRASERGADLGALRNTGHDDPAGRSTTAAARSCSAPAEPPRRCGTRGTRRRTRSSATGSSAAARGNGARTGPSASCRTTSPRHGTGGPCTSSSRPA